MKFKKINIFIIFTVVLGLFLPLKTAFFYADKTTHPGITDEVVDFYNLFFDEKITDQEKEWIVQGAIDEDIEPRWMNHYYDPVHNEGWDGGGTETEGGARYLPAWLVNVGARALISDKKPISSLNWLHDQERQTAYGDFGGNHTWEKAIYEFVANGNKKEAYYTLGFILHLIEDAAVPDHTRNDSHAPIIIKGKVIDEGSPYEQYADKFNRSNLNIARDLKNTDFKPVQKNHIDDYLRDLAIYSNKNFFSKDTVRDQKYSEPKIITEWYIDDVLYGIGEEDNGVQFPLIKISTKWNGKESLRVYSLEGKNIEPILSDYFTLLSRQAIIHGAGAINLFHKEVERAKQNPESLVAPPEPRRSNKAISFLSEKNKHGWTRGVAVFATKMRRKDPTVELGFFEKISASIKNIFSFNKDDDANKSTDLTVDDTMPTIFLENSNETVPVNAGLIKRVAIPVVKMDEIPRQARDDDQKIEDNSVIQDDEQVPNSIAESQKVKWVIDGDTFVLNDNKKVRLIGVDAPEVGECFYGEAKEFLMDLTLNKDVILEKDVSEVDSYDRLLRYVHVNDIFVNDYMVREGYVTAWEFPPDVKYANQFLKSQEYAQENGLGLWGDCDVEDGITSSPRSGETSRNDSGSGGNSRIFIMGNSNSPVEPESESESDPDPDPDPDPEPQDTTPPDVPIITTNNGENFLTTTTPRTISGIMSIDTDAILLNSSSDGITLYDASWDAQISLSEGDNLLSFTAQDTAQNESSADTITITLDSTGPSTTTTITNYNLMSTTFNVSWLATDADVATTTYESQYKVSASGSWQELSIASGAEFTATQDTTSYYFRSRVKDVNNNQGDWSSVAEVEINTTPIIFNEIAWMGTDSDWRDEWFELYNVSGQDVDLKGWSIEATVTGPDILIDDASRDTIVIAANSYFLFEKSNDNVVSNIEADFIYQDSYLDNGGENLKLKDSSGNIIDEISAGAWYAGDNTTKKTMERVRADVVSTNLYNWLTYEGTGGAAQDSGGTLILGTPKAQNSVYNQYYAVGGLISSDTTFYNSKSPYFVYSSLNVLENKTLTVEAGVNISVGQNLRLDINGTLKSLGTNLNRVAFSSNLASPEAGDWDKIYFAPTSQNSQLTHTDILYSGRWISGSGFTSAAIEVATADVSFDNILVKDSELRGLWLKGSDSTIQNSTFDTINIKGGSVMVEIDGGSPQISSSVFRNSSGGSSNYGIGVNGGTPTISNNSLSGANYAMLMASADPVFSGNTATGNSVNGIHLIGESSQIKTDITLEKDLPYYINSMIYVKNGATLTINPGVEIQIYNTGSGIEVQDGTLDAIGAVDDRITFTNSAGSWKWINFTSSASASSEIKYATIENGGYGTFASGAMIKVDSVDVVFDNVEIKNSKTRGIWLIDSDSSITNSLFECNASNFDACSGGSFTNVAGLDIQNSSPIVSSSTFNLNRIGIQSDGTSTPVFENIMFGAGDEANYVDMDPSDLIP